MAMVKYMKKFGIPIPKEFEVAPDVSKEEEE